jgi:glycosyltransferase involved in cell wall biosynthesis
MIKALAQERTERVELNIVGDGALAGDLVKLAADLGVKERLHFHGALRDAELLRAYQQADFFILPSLSESFSMSLLEAMACGLPVVASNVILVRPGDSKAFAEAITMMAQSEERRHTFAANNRAKIRRRYTWEQITTEYFNQCYRWSPTELQHRAPQPTL